MAALRVFWAKSLLNKGVVLGLVFLVCCCPVGLAGRGGNSAATAPTAAPTEAAAAAVEADEPTATAAPTETAEPTEEPAPTATPEPEPTVTPAPAAGIGVSRGDVQSIYERAGFAFEASALANGQERVIGTSSDSSLIELIGPAEELTKATAMVGFSRTNENQRQISALYITGLISKVAPQHLEEISGWVGERLSTQEDGELVTGPFRSSVLFLPADDGVVAMYTIEAVE